MPPVPVAAALGLVVLPVPVVLSEALAVLPVPVVLSEAVAVMLVPSVLSEVFVLIVVLLFPASSALLTIGAASSVPLMTSVTSFRDIFFFFMCSPFYLLLHAFFHAMKGISSGSMLASLMMEMQRQKYRES